MKIGTDIIEIRRFQNKLDNRRLMDRIYTPAEQAYITARGAGRFAAAAGLFCAKEAGIKAIGTGFIGRLRLTDLEITHDAYGAPLLRVKGETGFSLSISHSREYAVACVLWEDSYAHTD